MGIAIIVPNCDFSGANLGKVTLSGIPVSEIIITGDSDVMGASAQYSIDYIPAKTSERGVVWSIVSGGEYALIDSNTGSLTIRSTANNSQVVIKATSIVNSDVYATKTITVTYANLVIKEGMALVSDGTAYLNAAQYFTGSKRWNASALNMEIVFKIYETGSGNLHVFGISKSNATYLDAVYLGSQSSLRFGGDKYADIFSDSANIANSLYKFSSYMGGDISIEKDENVVFTKAVIGSKTSQTDLFPLFARNSNGGSGWTTYPGAANVGIYSFKLSTEADGAVCDLVPCLFNDVPAMYDKISKLVLTTVDGGLFTLRQ